MVHYQTKFSTECDEVFLTAGVRGAHQVPKKMNQNGLPVIWPKPIKTMDMVKYNSGFGTASVYAVFTQRAFVKVATSAVGINKFT